MINDLSVVVDGPDGSGKSTLVERLANLTGSSLAVSHHGPYRKHREVAHHYAEALARYYRGGTAILDRSWLSEPIYGRVYRGGQDRIQVGRRRMLERLALSTRTVVVLALPPWEVVRQNFNRRRAAEYLDHEGQLREVYRRFKDLVLRQQVGLSYVIYDYATDSLGDLVNTVLRYRPNYNEGPGSGSWWPHEATLLVGDRYNHGGPGVKIPKQLPFAPFTNRGCSAWFAEKLEALGIPERDLYWVNATGPDGRATNPAFVERLAPRRVIALGGNAERWCRDSAGLQDFRTVNHPSHQKRFYYHEPWTTLEEAFR